MGMLKKAVSEVKLKKGAGGVYRFEVKMDKEVAQFIALLTVGHKNVKVESNIVKFAVDGEKTTAGEFIAFAKAAKVLK
jgi:hypothetical protein